MVEPSWQMGDAKMSVFFSRDMACWTWRCLFGCIGWDFEGESEATNDFLKHQCPMDS